MLSGLAKGVSRGNGGLAGQLSTRGEYLYLCYGLPGCGVPGAECDRRGAAYGRPSLSTPVRVPTQSSFPITRRAWTSMPAITSFIRFSESSRQRLVRAPM